MHQTPIGRRSEERPLKIISVVFGATSLLAVVATGGMAQDVSAQPLGLADGATEATTIAFGCGPGFVPNVYGVCRPRFYGGYGYRRFGWHRPWRYGFGYRRRFVY